MAESSAVATVGAYVTKSRQVFADAVDRKLVAENPFVRLRGGSQKNAARLQYVPAADVLAVIDHCPDKSWAVLLALARFAGLRTPSETSLLKWSDVDRGRDRMTVHSPKTEHLSGRGERTVPIFPDLRPHLVAAWEQAADDVYVVGRLRRENPRSEAVAMRHYFKPTEADFAATAGRPAGKKRCAIRCGRRRKGAERNRPGRRETAEIGR